MICDYRLTFAKYFTCLCFAEIQQVMDEDMSYEEEKLLHYENGKATVEPSYTKHTSLRYYVYGAELLDYLSYRLMYPWIIIWSNLISCYIQTIEDKQHPQCKLPDYFVVGPMYIVLLICYAPFGLIGILLWICLCTNFQQEKFTYVRITHEEENCLELSDFETKQTLYTFSTANVLLAPEFIGRVNNIKNAKLRATKIAQSLLNHSGKHLRNLEESGSFYENLKKSDVIKDEFPRIDFLCLQEVWERSYAQTLIDELKEEFSHFLYDIGEYSYGINLFMMGSGLMFASKKTILAADFKTFTFRTRHARCVSQGVLCVQILLEDLGKFRRTGFVSNLHTQAFQENDAVIASQLSEAYAFIHMFKFTHTEETDVVDFDVICGDFNADNMSPADSEIQYHPIFTEYRDVCVKEPGQDHKWSIGTEMRQAMLYRPNIWDPVIFKKFLIDDSLRRTVVLDADVLIHGHHLMTSVVQPDKDGFIPAIECGGKRRVDRILYREQETGSEVVGYAFVSSLCNLTDHIPVCLTIRTLQYS